jgi:hypothetical protein
MNNELYYDVDRAIDYAFELTMHLKVSSFSSFMII